MSVRLLKCYGYCGSSYPKEQLIKVGTQNHCQPCAERKEQERKDRDILYKTIQTIFKIPYPNGQMLRQIKEFGETRNYTLEGITKTLCYFVKVQKKEPFLNGGLSFLPFHYDNAIKYYHDLEEKRKNFIEVNETTKVITINLKRSVHQDELRRRKFVDLGGLLNDN